MIIDTIDNLGKYVALNPLFADVVDYLARTDLASLPDGKHEIKGSDLFVNITTAKGKTEEEAVMETHIKMVDIQIPISAPESYGYMPKCHLPEGEYNEAKDITKIAGVKGDCVATCKTDMMVIFFPQDGHAPCISDCPALKKAIFKVKAAQ